jgi:hypothetical protein
MMYVNEDVKSASISAVKILANGERVDLGVIAFYHRNPLKRFAFYIRKLFGA